MAYTLQSYQEYAADPFRVRNGRDDTLLAAIRRDLEVEIQQRGFPAIVTVEEVKIASGMLARKVPMLVIRHPNPPFKYQEVGVIVNSGTVTFPLWGRNVQRSKNMSKANHFKPGAGLLSNIVGALMPGEDPLLAQEEANWIGDVVRIIKGGFEHV